MHCASFFGSITGYSIMTHYGYKMASWTLSFYCQYGCMNSLAIAAALEVARAANFYICLFGYPCTSKKIKKVLTFYKQDKMVVQYPKKKIPYSIINKTKLKYVTF